MDRPLRRAWRCFDDGSAPRRVQAVANRHRRGPADEEVSKVDDIVDRGADRLQQKAETLATEGGVKAKLADELAEDAAFLRKLKPSLMAARARGEAPTNQKPGEDVVAPSRPQLPKRPKPPGDGPNPFLVIGAALVAGIFLAKLIDWRGHAHPRD